MWAPFVFVTVVVTTIVWLTQSLNRVDLLVEHGQTLAMFGGLTLLIVPSLLAVVIPFALLGAALYALHRLHSDSEIAVIFAAGVGRFQLAWPILLVTTLGALATFYINVDLMPRSYRLLKQKVAEIKADFVSSVLRDGEFSTIADGFTIYVEKAEPHGRFTGLLIHDYRNGDKAETYMAQRALIRDTGIGPILYLSNGNVQSVNEKTGAIDIVNFKRTAVNLGQFKRPGGDFQLELTERYVGELLHPDLTRSYDRQHAGELIAEGHNRFASPFYAYAYVLFALVALISGAYNRRGYAVRIALACMAAGVLRVTGFVAQKFAADHHQYWIVYAPVAIAIVLSVLVLLGAFSRLAPRLSKGDA